MSIVVLGVNHRSAPLDVIERVAVAEESLTKALHSLVSRDNVRETVLLSTCNRTEVYVVAEKFHGAYADVRDYFCELSGLTPDELHPHFYSQHDEAAVSHLFEVASGLDSAVIGETEILGQVRDAWDLARIEQTSRTTLNMLFRQALEVGKRARNETGISKSTTSISHAAVEMAKELLGTMQSKSVLVVGAGDMGAGIARALSSAGAASVTVMNRNTQRAEQLAATVGAVVSPISELANALGMADVVLEPYGGQVLDMAVATTTRLTAVLAAGGLVGFAIASRVLLDGADPVDVAWWGTLLGLPAFALIIAAGPLGAVTLFVIGTGLAGLGAGLFGHGTLTATMRRAPRAQVGLALGAWGAVQATSAGIAVALGGVIRDVIAAMTNAPEMRPEAPYTPIFALEFAFLALTLAVFFVLRRREAGLFQTTHYRPAQDRPDPSVANAACHVGTAAASTRGYP